MTTVYTGSANPLSLYKHYKHTMPKVKCPLPDCEFETEDLETPIVAALLTDHSLSHLRGNEATAKAKKVKRPTISASGTSETGRTFYDDGQTVDATKIKGKDKVIQILECCDDPLRKNLTRSAGGSLATKTPKDLLAAIINSQYG